MTTQQTIVIATLNTAGKVISFVDFLNEDQLDRCMVAAKAAGHKVKTMAKDIALSLSVDADAS